MNDEIAFGPVMDRLAEALQERTDTDLARRIGMTQPAYANRKRAQSIPYEAVIRCALNEGIDLAWVFAGQPSRLAERRGAYTQTGQLANSDFVHVPRLAVQAAGGDGAVVESEQVVDYFAYRRDWLRGRGLDPAHLALIEVVGDSMAPALSQGDTVLVDLRPAPLRPAVYVIRLGDTLLVKYVQTLPGGAIQLSSESERYPPIGLSAEQLAAGEAAVIGRVVASTRDWT